MTHPGISFVTFLLGILGGVGCTELCYIDANTGQGVYCDPNCCGSPTYCCDKESLTVQSAVFGSLGMVMIVTMVVCFVTKKLKKNKKKQQQVLPVSKKPMIVSVIAAAGTAGGNFGPMVDSEKSGSFRLEQTSHPGDREQQSLPNVPMASAAGPRF